MTKTNPYGANGVIVDPRQVLFIKHYFDPKSETFGVITHSALKAGYGEYYSKALVAHMPDWLSKRIKQMHSSAMLAKARRNLDEALDINIREPVIGAFGPIVDKDTQKPVTKRNAKVLAIKIDVSKFVAERLGREEFGLEAELKGPTIANFTQIIINSPDGRTRKKVGNIPDAEAVLGVAGTDQSPDS